MRNLFTDGWNSIWHVLFGMFGFYFGWVFILFFAYELHNPKDENVIIDLFEFTIGYFVILNLYVFNKSIYLRKLSDWFGKIRLLK